MKNSCIGVFDSGLGGLTTVKEIRRLLPEENIVFLADTANMPYGSKDRQQILSFTQNNIAIIRKYDPKAIVIACNTSDSNAGEMARSCFSPVFGVIAPAVQTALKATLNNKIGVLATQATIRAGAYEKQIHEQNPDIEVISVACPALVPMIEHGDFIYDQERLQQTTLSYLEKIIAAKADTLILGCTHYDVLDEMIAQLYPELKIVSSSRCVVESLKAYLNEHDLQEKDRKGELLCLASSDPETINQTAVYLIDKTSFHKVGEI